MYYHFKNKERRERWKLLTEITTEILLQDKNNRNMRPKELIKRIETDYTAPSFFITRDHGRKLVSAIEGSDYQNKICERPIEMRMAVDLYKVFRDIYLEKSPIRTYSCVELAINHEAPSFYIHINEAASLLNLLR